MRPFSILTGKLRAQPLSAPVASPCSRSMIQLCSGQAALRPCTMPSASGPPLCGQRFSSANTSSLAVRNTAISRRGVFTVRAPRGGIACSGPMSNQNSWAGFMGITSFGCDLADRLEHRERHELVELVAGGALGPRIAAHRELGFPEALEQRAAAIMV